MSLDVAYSYCINLTEEEKLEIDKQVRKNRFELKYAIFFPFLPVEGFTPQQIVRNARDRAESAIAEKLAPLAQLADDCQEAYKHITSTKFIRKCLLHYLKFRKKFEKIKKLVNR